MGVGGSFPIDLILFGMIAAFLVLRLKSILGKRTGFERPPQPAQRRDAMPPTEQPAAPRQAMATPATRAMPPEPGSPLDQTLTRMKAIDRNFEPTAFLDAAGKAFQIIARAFAAGDRESLRPLLNDETWEAFDRVIREREKNGHTQVTDIRSIHSLSIDAAELIGTQAAITVRIVSDQVNMTRSESGEMISGTDAVTEINERWKFARDLTQPNPNWLLVATHGP